MTNHPEATICDGCRLIPLSRLSLDVDEPVVGWAAALGERGVEIVPDDLGRPSVARHVLGELLAEYAARRQAAEQAALEAAQTELPAPVPAGIPASEGLSAVETLMSQPDYESVNDEFGRPKPNFLDEELAAGRKQAAELRAEQEAVERAREVLEGRDNK